MEARLRTGLSVVRIPIGVGDFSHLFIKTSIPALGPTQPHIQWTPGFFPGDKAAGP